MIFFDIVEFEVYKLSEKKNEFDLTVNCALKRIIYALFIIIYALFILLVDQSNFQ